VYGNEILHTISVFERKVLVGINFFLLLVPQKIYCGLTQNKGKNPPTAKHQEFAKLQLQAVSPGWLILLRITSSRSLKPNL